VIGSVFWRADKRRFVAKYKAADGEWKPKECPREIDGRALGPRDRARARRWAEGWAREQRIEPLKRGGGLALKAAYAIWIDIAADERDVAPSTLKGYRSDFAMHILADSSFPTRARISDREIASLVTDHPRLEAWLRAVIARTTSSSRARSVFTTLKVFFDAALFKQWVRGINPLRLKEMRRLLPAMPTKRERPPVIVPLEHVQALVLARHGDLRADIPPARRVRYAVAFTSGKREGETSGMTWGQLHLAGPVPYLEVEKARRLVRAKGEKLGRLKTKTSPRTLPLHPAAVAALRWWRDDPRGVLFDLGRAPRPEDPVFPSMRPGRRGDFARPRSADKLRFDLAALGLPTTGAKDQPITMQASRRTVMTALERLDVPEAKRKALVGHGIHDVGARFYEADGELGELAAHVKKIPLRWEDPPDEDDVGSMVAVVVPALVAPATTAPSPTSEETLNTGRRRRDSNSR
jgi:hypothetical protein